MVSKYAGAGGRPLAIALLFSLPILMLLAPAAKLRAEPPAAPELAPSSEPGRAPRAAESPQASARRGAATPAIGEHRQSSWVGAGLALGVLNLPKVGVGAELLTELRTRPLWPLEFRLVYWFDNHAELGLSDLDLMVHPYVLIPFPAGGSRLRVSGAQLSVATCPLERRLGSDSLLICGGVQGGVVRVAAEGFAGDKDTTHPSFGFELFARYHFELGARFGISYSAGLFLALLRERYGYRDREDQFREAFRSSLVGGRLDLALTYSL